MCRSWRRQVRSRPAHFAIKSTDRSQNTPTKLKKAEEGALKRSPTTPGYEILALPCSPLRMFSVSRWLCRTIVHFDFLVSTFRPSSIGFEASEQVGWSATAVKQQIHLVVSFELFTRRWDSAQCLSGGSARSLLRGKDTLVYVLCNTRLFGLVAASNRVIHAD